MPPLSVVFEAWFRLLTDVWIPLATAAATIAIAVTSLWIAWRAHRTAERAANAETARSARADRVEFVARIRVLLDTRSAELREGRDENKPLYAYEERGIAEAIVLDSPNGEVLINWLEAALKYCARKTTGMYRGNALNRLKGDFELRVARWIRDPTLWDPSPFDFQKVIMDEADRADALRQSGKAGTE